MGGETQDLTDPSKTPLDLYKLLSLPNPVENHSTPLPDVNEIKKRFRKESLRCHPDKAPPGQHNIFAERFHRLSIAYDILSDETKRVIYNSRLEKERRQKAEKDAFSRKRKQMMAELEKKESAGRDGFLDAQNAVKKDGWETPERPRAGTKRTHSSRTGTGSSTPLSEEQEQRKRRLAEEARKRMAEFSEQRKRRQGGFDETVAGTKSNETPITKPDGTPLPDTPSRSGSGSGSGGAKMDLDGKKGEKKSNGTSNFSFSPAATGRGPVKDKRQGFNPGPSSSAPGGSLFESMMSKLKEAQRQKDEARLKTEEASKVQQAA